MREPTLVRIAAALEKTTEILAAELAVPGDREPALSEFEWRIAQAVAAMQGISSLLYDRLQWRGPDPWRRFLQQQRLVSAARHGQIECLVREIDARARDAGIPMVALKGAALHALGVYAAGQRPMADVDLLIRPEHGAATERLLDHCGYSPALEDRRHRVFQPRAGTPPVGARLGEHADAPVKIEVHSKISERLPVAETDITRFVFPRVPRAGINPYPSAAALMMHLLLHAAGNMRARALRLIQLHDIALLAARFDVGEWEDLLAARPENRRLWWAHAPLMLASRYYPAAFPSTLSARSGIDCPRLLRSAARRQRLIDVSWSNIRIRAFPGVEWSRSLPEALSFMHGRLWPKKDSLAELKVASALVPGAETVPWYGIPHGMRIVRWLFSRPPRVQTLLCVRAALTPEA